MEPAPGISRSITNFGMDRPPPDGISPVYTFFERIEEEIVACGKTKLVDFLRVATDESLQVAFSCANPVE
jgi:hypothetical protein